MKIAIIGSGYVGLPLAIAFSKHYKVICFDININRVKELKKGNDLNKQHTKKEVLQKKIIYTSDVNLLKNINIFIITVPTPINNSNQPDLTMLEQASELVGKNIKKNSIIVYESTTYPGCTEEICIPLLEKNSKLKYMRDFNVAYSPERVNPGDKINTLKNITKIVGADDKKILTKVGKLYQIIVRSVYLAGSIKIAESAKVIENIQRDVNIALVNELSVLFNKLDIPTNEVLKAAATKWNFHYYKPGLVGGHCISVDPYYLAYKAEQKNYFPELILSGRRFNEGMGNYIAEKTINLLAQNKVNIVNSKIAILGFSFKENIRDIRNTKVIQIIKELQNWRAEVKIFDSIVSKNEVNDKFNLKIHDFNEMKKFKYDAIILAVSHNEFLKKLSFYDKFYKNKKNKTFIDLKNNYSVYDLKNNKFNFFQL
jgi:UDP-N-acetyl-D-glucosamine/UDP-N-acetyl-D-galactosamine dehydrogenase